MSAIADLRQDVEEVVYEYIAAADDLDAGPLGLSDYAARLEHVGGDWLITRFVVRRLWSRDPAAPSPTAGRSLRRLTNGSTP
jgi:hypothetical protein